LSNQVKKPPRASSRKTKVKAKGRAGGKASASPAGRKSGSGPERIPVRGARKSKVKVRAAAETGVRNLASESELAETRELATAAMEAALDKHALAPILIDVSAMGSYTDFIGIVSGRSDRQVDAIADNVCQALKQRGRYLLGQEGTGSGRWTLLDFGAFVIHVFYHPVREFYDLESLWIEAPRVKLEVPPEAILPQSDALYGAL
jgi:ribosome-associated protein